MELVLIKSSIRYAVRNDKKENLNFGAAPAGRALKELKVF
jgi:hypothetical protein